jgi:hypothetical protein
MSKAQRKKQMPRARNRRNKQSSRVWNSGQQLLTNPTKSIVPYNYRTTMTYGYTWLNNTAIPGFYDWVIRANSVYDPDVALGGDSAYGTDQIKAMWQMYRVIGSRIKISVVNLDATNPVNVVLIPNASSAAYAAAQQDGLLNHPRAKNMMVDRYDGSKCLSHTMTTTQAFGVRDVDDIGFSAAFNADPSHIWYWHIVSFNNAGVAANCELRLEVWFDTICSEPYPMNV